MRFKKLTRDYKLGTLAGIGLGMLITRSLMERFDLSWPVLQILGISMITISSILLARSQSPDRRASLT